MSKKEKGGAALEYVLVSTFATVVAISLIGFASRFLQEKVNAVAEKLGIASEELANPFD